MAALVPTFWQLVMTSNQNGYPINRPFSTHAARRLIPGAGVTPAEGSVKPTAGFTFNKVNAS
jgi:hypothetical protein